MGKDDFTNEYKKYVDPNETFFQKVLRYANHYKVVIICVVLLIAVIVVMTITMRTKTEYDYQVFFVADNTGLLDTPEGKENNVIYQLETFLNQLVNENEETNKKVNVTFIYIGDDPLYTDVASNNKTQLVSSMTAGEALLVISDSQGMEFLKSIDRFFLNLEDIVDNADYDGIAFKLSNSEKALEQIKYEGDLYYLICNYENSWLMFSKSNQLNEMMNLSKSCLEKIKD